MITRLLLTLCLALGAAVCRGQNTNAGRFHTSGWADPLDSAGLSDGSPEPLGLPGDSGSGGAVVAEAVTPEIQALARGLENDPTRIFDYVHDHIRHVFYFGSK